MRTYPKVEKFVVQSGDTARWRVQSSHQRGTCLNTAGRDGVGDGQSRQHLNFQVHVRGTIVGATGVIQNAQESLINVRRKSHIILIRSRPSNFESV